MEVRSLWYRVLVARYGEVGGCLAKEGKANSVSWNNLINIKSGVGVGVGRWFDDHLGRKIDDGTETLFWWDLWLDGMILKRNFSRLFHLAVNKMATVAEMFSLGWGEGGEVWKWQRRLLAWEEDQVRECCVILTNVVLQPNTRDRWLWHLHSSHKYNVTSVYNYLLSSVNLVTADHTKTIWNNEVPLKVNLFSWLLLRNRLPTMDNLIRRRILHLNTQLCAGGCSKMEDVDHLFLSCNFFGKIWFCIYN